MSGLLASVIAVTGGLGVVLVLAGGGNQAEAQPIPCEQWQQMHPGWPCADVPTFSPQPTQAPNTGAPAPPPTLLAPPSAQGGPGGGAGALTPPPLQAPPNMNNPIVPVPGYTPPVLPGNPLPAAPELPRAAPSALPDSSIPGQEPPVLLPRPNGNDLVEQLRELAKLHAEGVLSDAEFVTAKQRLLNGQVPVTSAPIPTTKSPSAGAPAQSALEPVNHGVDPRVAALALVGAVAFTAGAGSPLLFRRSAGAGPLSVSPASRNPPPSPDPIPIFPDGKVPIIITRPGGLEGGRGTIGWLQQGTDTGQLQVNYHIDSPPGTEYVTDGLDVWVDGQYQRVKVMDLGGGNFSATIQNVRPGSHVQISNYTAMQFPNGTMGATDFNGTLIPLNGKAYIDPRKLDYLFNVDIAPDDHNTPRANQNEGAFLNIGLRDTPENRAYIEQQLINSVLYYGYEPPAETNKWGTTLKNYTVIYGPLGQMGGTAFWQIDPDGSLRLTSFQPSGLWSK